MRKQRGFTLIELVVVIAILGILAGIAIPRFLDAQASARGAKVVANLRSIDSAANIYMIKVGAVPTDMKQITEDAAGTPEHYRLLEPVADADGAEFIVTQNDGGGKKFQNISGPYGLNSEGRGVLNNNTVEDYLGSGNKNNVAGYLSTSSDLLSTAQGMSGKVWENLRSLYTEAYGGAYPTISDTEKGYISTVAQATLDSLTWKPTIISDGSVIMIASNGTATNNAYMVYYEGSYYYHCNANNAKNSAWINDQKIFDITTVTNSPTTGDRWVKIDS